MRESQGKEGYCTIAWVLGKILFKEALSCDLRRSGSAGKHNLAFLKQERRSVFLG